MVTADRPATRRRVYSIGSTIAAIISRILICMSSLYAYKQNEKHSKINISHIAIGSAKNMFLTAP